MNHLNYHIPLILEKAGLKQFKKFALVDKGLEASVFCLENENKEKLALKIYPLLTQAAEEEFFVLNYLSDYNFISPKAVDYGQYEGHSYIIQEWIDGVSLLHYCLKNPIEMTQLGFQFGQWQARLHAIPPFIDKKELFRWSPMINLPNLERQVKELAISDAICHFDFHPLNILVREGKIVSVVDFTLVTLADRRADLGITRTFLDVGPLLYHVDSQISMPLKLAWEEGYKSESGSFPLNPLFHAWSAYYLLLRSIHFFSHTPDNLAFFKALENYAKRLYE